MDDKQKQLVQHYREMLPVELEMLDIFRPDVAQARFAAGVASAISVLSFKGSKWSVIAGGETKHLVDENGSPITTMRAVIVDSTDHVSKTYYASGYEEGSDAPPDCASYDGVYPDKDVPSPQAKSCSACKWNAFGSDPETGKGKACREHKRAAVLAADDLKTAPHMLRVPIMSLRNMRDYGNALAGQGLTPARVITLMGFEPGGAYPKLTFKAIKVLEPAELRLVVDQLPATAELLAPLSTGTPAAEALPEPEAAPAPVAETPAPTPAPVVETPPPAPAPEPEPVMASETTTNVVQMAEPEAPESADDPKHADSIRSIMDTLEGLESLQP